jgi:hypothetical protein
VVQTWHVCDLISARLLIIFSSVELCDLCFPIPKDN